MRLARRFLAFLASADLAAVVCWLRGNKRQPESHTHTGFFVIVAFCFVSASKMIFLVYIEPVV